MFFDFLSLHHELYPEYSLSLFLTLFGKKFFFGTNHLQISPINAFTKFGSPRNVVLKFGHPSFHLMTPPKILAVEDQPTIATAAIQHRYEAAKYSRSTVYFARIMIWIKNRLSCVGIGNPMLCNASMF
jgi:hypothetical protein